MRCTAFVQPANDPDGQLDAEVLLGLGPRGTLRLPLEGRTHAVYGLARASRDAALLGSNAITGALGVASELPEGWDFALLMGTKVYAKSTIVV